MRPITAVLHASASSASGSVGLTQPFLLGLAAIPGGDEAFPVVSALLDIPGREPGGVRRARDAAPYIQPAGTLCSGPT